jgi:type VII secretion-associated serine protease mycosin
VLWLSPQGAFIFFFMVSQLALIPILDLASTVQSVRLFVVSLLVPLILPLTSPAAGTTSDSTSKPPPPHAAVILDSRGSLQFHRLDGTGGLPQGSVLAISANPRASTLDLPPFASSDDPRSQEQWALRAIGARPAWEIAKGASVVIAVVDTGVSPHEDLPTLQPGKSFLSDPSTDDPNGHGTHVAGIIASAMDNKVGVAGLAPSASILPVRVLDAEGSGDHVDIAAGIVWAVDQGADIVNLSLGGEESSEVLQASIKYAAERGVLVVAAAGNSGFGSNAPVYPAAYEESIAVAATGPDGSATAFSNSGAYVDVAAPGFAILSTAPSNTYEYLSGTSQAAPYISAALALLLSTGLSPSQAVAKLYASAKDPAPPGRDSTTGNGVLDAAAALGAPATAAPSLPSPLPNLPVPTLPTLRPPSNEPHKPTPLQMVSIVLPASVRYGTNFNVTLLASGCAPCKLTVHTPGVKPREVAVRSDLTPVVFSERALRSGRIEVFSHVGVSLAASDLHVDPAITVSPPSRRGAVVQLSGSVKPATTKVALQQLRSGRWVAITSVQPRSETFRIKLTSPRRGLYRIAVGSTTSDPFFL